MYGSSASAVSAQSDGSVKACVTFSITSRVGSLATALEALRQHDINMLSIQSRPSKTASSQYDFLIDIEGGVQEERVKLMVDDLVKKGCFNVKVFGSKEAPWFPRKIKDLDIYANKVLEYGAELSADHPGFNDPVYRERRADITRNAKEYRYGSSIPRVEYTPEEIQTWRTVYLELKKLFATHACKAHNHVFPLLEANCGYSENNIPQLQDISEFLKDTTGFTLRPVMGLLSPRDFLNGLAFRVFHSTQYIRHHSRPLYTPEPDVCHELLGHVPLFADPDFADFSQEIGLASLGASDDDIKKLATCYWFTVEFGLCREGDTVKAFGAGLLSSFGELEYCLSDKPKHLPFDPVVASLTEYPITQYQPLYFVARSFEDAKLKMKEFAKTLDRPFDVWLNPITQTIEVLSTPQSLKAVSAYLCSTTSTLHNAITKLS